MLAIAETIAASGLSFWLAWRLGSIKHIVLASAVVPFLLLRTPLSTRYAVRAFRETVRRTDKFDGFGIFVFEVPFLTIIMSCVKILTTTGAFFRTPLRSVQAIPRNLVFGIAVLDVLCPPQFFPGLEVEKGSYSYLHSYNLVTSLIKKYRPIFVGILGKRRLGPSIIMFLFLPVLVVTFGPLIILAFAYRWALKSTATLWLPLMWVVIQAQPGTHIMARLVVMTRSAWAKAMLVYSALVLLAFLAKLALLLGILHLANLDWLGPLGVAATRLAAPYELPLWQVGGATNALLAWFFFFHADRHLLAQGTTEACPEVRVRREYALFQVARTTLSLYVIACTFYISAAVAWQTEWPPIRFVLFPWTS